MPSGSDTFNKVTLRMFRHVHGLHFFAVLRINEKFLANERFWRPPEIKWPLQFDDYDADLHASDELHDARWGVLEAELQLHLALIEHAMHLAVPSACTIGFCKGRCVCNPAMRGES